MSDIDTTQATNETPSESANSAGGEKTSGTTQAQTIAQEEANRLIGEARKKGREVGVNEYRKALGIEGLELSDADIKTLIADAVAKREADKSEAQKALDAKAAAEKRATDLEAALNTERQKRLADRRDAAIRKMAKDAIDADDVVEQAAKVGGAAFEAIVKVDGDTITIDEKKAEEVVKAVREAKPHYFGRSGGMGSPSVAGGRVPATTNKEAQERMSRLNQQRIRG